MFSGAELAAIINEAAIGATLQNKDFVEQDDLEEARDKVRYGRSRTSHKIEEDEKKIIAYHEAGHAIIMYFDEHSDPLHKVTIIPRGQALGVTFMLPEKDRHLMSKNRLLGQLRVTFGGRIAEDMFCGDITSGAAMDIRQATQIARAMVTEYGMSRKTRVPALRLRRLPPAVGTARQALLRRDRRAHRHRDPRHHRRDLHRSQDDARVTPRGACTTSPRRS